MPESLSHLAWAFGRGGLDWCEADGFGMRPLSWQEIDAYCRSVAPHLQPWERRQIRAMSTSYVDGFCLGKFGCVRAPVYKKDEDDPGLADERAALSKKLLAGFSAMSS